MTGHRPQHATTGAHPAGDDDGERADTGPGAGEGTAPGSPTGPGDAAPQDWEPMPAAPLPTRSGPVGVVGPILAVLLILVGLALLREALVGYRLVGGPAWLPVGLLALDGRGPTTAWLVGGIVAALLGLWLIYSALRRRVRSRAALRSRTGIYLAAGDVARLASAAAEEVGGVISASSTAGTRTVRTTIRTTGGAGVDAAVLDAVHDRLAALEPVPRVTVVVRGPDGRKRS